jgi:hypothetical protein
MNDAPRKLAHLVFAMALAVMVGYASTAKQT